MNLTNQCMQSDWFKALGWTFVHSLWQITAIGFLLYIILRLIPGRSAHVRYTISTMAFWMIVLMVLSTFIIMLPDSKPITEITSQVILVKATGTFTLTDRISMWLESRMPMMLSIWFGGVLILMIRLVFSLGWVQHMRSAALPLESIQNTLNELIHRLQLRIKPFASESGFVSSPVTIGHIIPLILFPIGIINQLTTKEVEAILTHELAHIVRRDYLSNLIQTFIETLFYYHPVTWWISGMVRIERENRADDLAVSWCGDHLGYAKALITVQEMQVGNTPSLAIGFASRKGAMLARIQRILHIPYKNHNQMEKTVLISLCSLCLLGFTLNSHTNTDQQKENASQATEFFSFPDPTSDSIPNKGTYRIHKKTDNQDISIEVKDGDIKELQIDGKEIAPAEFDQYGKVIDELFGAIETPPSMERFNFEMPVMPMMPLMPDMPPMTYSFEMPSMPRMPAMPSMEKMELERLLGEGSNISLWNDENMSNYKILQDSLGPRGSRIIIIRNGDSTVIFSPHMERSGDAPAMNLDQYIENNIEWKQQQEYLKQLNKELKQNWQEHGQEEWRAQEEQLRERQNHLRSEGDRIREEEIERHRNGDYERAIEEELRAEGMGRGRGYSMLAPRMNMTDEMIEEGLVEPGEEVEILLTPDKLKINGKKMPDQIHQKYLEMYEAQQGVELSGNSRIEFTTKSRRSM